MSDEQDQVHNEDATQNPPTYKNEQEKLCEKCGTEPCVCLKDVKEQEPSEQSILNQEVGQDEKKPPKVRWI